MSKVIVRGSAPGMMRVEVEGTELHIDISTSLPAYTAVQELAAFMEVLLQAVPPGYDPRAHWPSYDLAEPKATKSVAPKAHK